VASPREYIESKLKDGETVVYRTGIHPATLMAPLLLVLIAGLSVPVRGTSAVVFLLMALLFTVATAIGIKNSELAVTTGTRLLGKVSFLTVKFYDIDLARIVDISVTQPALGKILNFGRVKVRFENGTGKSFRMISNPVGLVRAMQDQTNISKARLDAEANKA